MALNLAALKRPSDLPAADARVPALALRALLALAGALLTSVAYSDGWIAVGVLLSLLAALQPDFLFAWILILFLGIGELSQHAALHWQLLVLLAGVHLLHVLAMLTLELPWRSWVQPAVFRAPLLRFVAIQIPAQAFGVVVLLALAPNAHGHRPVTFTGFAVIGAAALAGLAVLFLRALPVSRADG